MPHPIPGLGEHNFPGRRTFIVTLKNHEHLESFYRDMETSGGPTPVPERVVECVDRMPASRSTHYTLTYDEAVALLNDPRVLDIELNPEDRKIILGHHGFAQTSNNFSKKSASDPNDVNWALLRCLRTTDVANWGIGGTSSISQSGTIVSDVSGKNVDVLICDGGVPYASTLEYAQNPDGSGYTRMVDLDWYTYDVSLGYAPSSGYNLYQGRVQDHQAHTTGTAAGNSQGWARDANIYNFTYNDLLLYARQFHRNKPVNPLTGVKNPTIMNNSWGYTSISYNIKNINEIHYRGTVYYPTNPDINNFGNWLWDPAVLANTKIPQNPTITTSGDITVSSRSSYVDSTFIDIMNQGVVAVASAGNDYCYADVMGGPDYDNYFVESLGQRNTGYVTSIAAYGQYKVAGGYDYHSYQWLFIWYNGTNWHRSKGWAGGAIRAVDVHPTTHEFFLAGSYGIISKLDVTATSPWPSWQVQALGGSTVYGIARRGTTAIVVGGSGQIAKSQEGRFLDIASSANTVVVNSAMTFYSVADSGSIYVAVGSDGTGNVAIVSSADGVSWTQRAANQFGGFLYSVTYGNGQFVGVGSPSQTGVVTSTDGITWTQRTTAGQFTGYLDRVIWTGSTFAAFGIDSVPGNTLVITSGNGNVWTRQWAGLSNTNMESAIAFGGNIYTVGQKNSYPYVSVSSDLLNFTEIGENIWGEIASDNIASTSEYYNRGASPASADGGSENNRVISVGAIGQHNTSYYTQNVYGTSGVIPGDYKAEFSNFGPRVDVWAPGSAIQSTLGNTIGTYDGTTAPDPRAVALGNIDLANNNFKKYVGTSMSAPQVTGVLACIAERTPNFTQANARAYLDRNSTATVMSNTTPISGGYLNDANALLDVSKNKFLYLRSSRIDPQAVSSYERKTDNIKARTGSVAYPRKRTLVANTAPKIFTITSNVTTANIGNTVMFTVTTTGVANGANIQYILSGLEPSGPMLEYIDKGQTGIFNSSRLIPGATLFSRANTGTRITTTSSTSGTSTAITSNLLGESGLTFYPYSTSSNPGYPWSNHYSVALPFAVSFAGATYTTGTTMYVSSSSLISFGDSDDGWYNITPSTPPVPKICISRGIGSVLGIWYGVSGTTPNRRFRIRWHGNGNNGSLYYTFYPPTEMTWEVTFYEEVNNQIDIQIGSNYNNQLQQVPYPFSYGNFDIPATGNITIVNNTGTLLANVVTDANLVVNARLGIYPTPNVSVALNTV